MKILCSLFVLFFLANISFSQLNQCKGNAHFKLSAGKIDSAIYQNYSIGGEYFVHDNISLNYNFDVFLRNDKIWQLHSSAGLIAGPPLIGLGIVSWISNSVTNNSADLGALGVVTGILLLILPEGVSFHLPYKYNWNFSTYANVLGVDFMKNNNSNKSYLRYAATFGVKTNYWNPKNYTIFSFFETRKVAGMGWSMGGGIGIGRTFGKRVK
jgi:hypothetical protein